jgi:hypothetical protein
MPAQCRPVVHVGTIRPQVDIPDLVNGGASGLEHATSEHAPPPRNPDGSGASSGTLRSVPLIDVGELIVTVSIGTLEATWSRTVVAVAAASSRITVCLWWVYFERLTGHTLPQSPVPAVTWELHFESQIRVVAAEDVNGEIRALHAHHRSDLRGDTLLPRQPFTNITGAQWRGQRAHPERIGVRTPVRSAGAG